MRRQIPACLCILALALAAASCSSHDKNAPLISAPNSPIADVPVPAGFTMTDDSISKIVPGSGLRFVDHNYKGSDDVLPVVKFFRDQLPGQGWTWVDQNQSRGGEVSLHFTKSNEDLFITVTPGTWHRNIRIKIDPTGTSGRSAPKE